MKYETPCPIHRENELWTHTLFYDEKCGRCSYIVVVGSRKFCGYCPPRCGLHQVIRHQIGCTWCKHSTKRLDCETCLECLRQHPDAKPFEIKSGIEDYKEWKKEMDSKHINI